ncbi:MAG: DUF167 domain-containing protein [bacterium]|nr:DUF167 domain-containing protein [bacterium]MDE0287219.1 DUF167 domain-containing protein [bacterium]MDE0439522.1 DUF167 domain-containing protein [bacterium]
MADRIGQMIRGHPHGVILTVQVTAGASRTEIVGPHGTYLRVRVAAPPTAGWANLATRRVLSEAFGCRVDLLSGARIRIKRMLLRGTDRDSVAEIISSLTR